MNDNDLLKKFSDFVKTVNTATELQNLINEKNYLQNFVRNITILKMMNRISKNNIDAVMNELILEFNKKFNANYKYDGNYLTTINLIVDDIERTINSKMQDKFKEKSIDKLLEEVFGNNE